MFVSCSCFQIAGQKSKIDGQEQTILDSKSPDFSFIAYDLQLANAHTGAFFEWIHF